ncbi:MAG TPA: DUF2339 domain-containing protein [Bryobacteraceae bacterium]|nr:DUF2339 domain-containing protein [Bryobacteraceae bacterium]
MTVLIFAVILVVVLVLWRRLRDLEETVRRDDNIIADLVRRVWSLENARPSQPAIEAPVSAAQLELLPIEQTAMVEEALPATPPPLPIFVQQAPEPAPEPSQDTWRDRARQSMGGGEWEAVVGGSWLNKLGVLVLVIGIALLLGYEFTRVGPGGRVAIGFATGLVMLAAGALVERKPVYAIFARGLLGGGWAALYFTTYAMHALPAARIIDDPYLASVLLLAVSAAMILHSLRYKSQTVSGLAYFIAFATLALSDSTPFSVLALVPLAGSLLFLAYRFNWEKMAVFGLFATYATCASRPDTGAPLASTQALFGAYWLLFEAFDLLSLRRRIDGWRAESFILPGNALGFLALSLVKWHRLAPAHLHLALAGGAGLYLVSALLRVHLRPPSGFTAGVGPLSRMAEGSYEGPITLAAALAAAAIVRGTAGEWINLGLLIEGEVLFLAGFFFGQKYLRGLAGAVFTGAVGNLLLTDRWRGHNITLAGYHWAEPAPVALLAAATFYLNRLLRVAEGALYTWVAAGLVTLVIGVETPDAYLAVAWLIFGAILLELGLRTRAAEFRWQSYFASTLGFLNMFWLHVVGVHKGSPPAAAVSLGVVTVLCCAMSWRVFRTLPGHLEDVERGWCRDLYAAAGTLFALTLAWLELPPALVALAWAVIGLVLLEIGFGASLGRFRLWGNLVAAAVCGRLFLANFTELGDTLHISHRVLTVVPIIVSQYYAWWRYRQSPAGGWEHNLARLYLYAPAVLAVALARFELGRTLAVTGWAVFGLALYYFGLARNLEDLRWQSYAIAALSFWRSWNTNFYIPESLGGIGARVATGAVVIACFYAALLLSPRTSAERETGRARAFYCLLATVLLAVLLFYEVSGGVLTMAWGAEALALLAAGFPLRDRFQRLSGLALFLLCVLKLFLYDLRELQTINRILSFIVLGAILVGVSWIYTRFRDRIQRYL